MSAATHKVTVQRTVTYSYFDNIREHAADETLIYS